MVEPGCETCTAPREVNPLLFAFFCPYCVLSGVYALLATGTVALPPLFGLAGEAYLAPVIILGTFFAWLAWGAWAKRSGVRQGGLVRARGGGPGTGDVSGAAGSRTRT